MPKLPILEPPDQQAPVPIPEEVVTLLKDWAENPVHYVTGALGAEPDPWQCDVLDTLADPDVNSVALRSCHGVGKTTIEAWAVAWFTPTRPYAKVPTTAPTFHRQVRDLLWADVAKWWRGLEQRAPWLAGQFELTTVRLQARAFAEWFSVGVASKEAVNIEGYHAPHIMVVFDEAKGIPKATWEAIHGMRTTAEAKILVASTPGGPAGEFHAVFTRYRTTWKNLFVVHPLALKEQLNRPEAVGLDPETGERVTGRYARSGTYYSPRMPETLVTERAEEWGADSPVFIARIIGDFPVLEGDFLIPYTWLAEAEDKEDGAPSDEIGLGIDVARYGRDRTIFLLGQGGTLLKAESVSRLPQETTALEARQVGVGSDPKRPRYRSVDVTADIAYRLFMDHGASWVAVDDTGVGGGVTDILRRRGVPTVPVNFGAGPIDRITDPEMKKIRARRGLTDTAFANLKAQMGRALQHGFETGSIALGRLPRPFTETLIQQTSLVRQQFDAMGRLKIIDPDDQEEDTSLGAAELEGRRSPDHFHALLVYWWVAGRYHKPLLPRAGAPQIPAHIAQIGEPARNGQLGWQAGKAPGLAPAAGRTGGQAGWLQRRYQ